MRTILNSSWNGKGDHPRPLDVKKYVENFDVIKKPCGCTFGKKCDPATCKKQS